MGLLIVIVLESSEQTDQIVREWYSSELETGDRSELQQKLQNLTERLAETLRRELEMNKQQLELEDEKQAVKLQLEQMRQRLLDGCIHSRKLYSVHSFDY